MNRRNLLKLTGTTVITAALPSITMAGTKEDKTQFRYCLNTSTISGQTTDLLRQIDIAAEAGYDGVELWITTIKEYLAKGKSLSSLANYLSDRKLKVENIISFTTWMVNDTDKRKDGVKNLEEEMKIAAALDCRRIAAPPAGVEKHDPIDFLQVGGYYHDILALGREYRVIPQLEFWGASGTLYHLGQALAIAAAADDPDACILADIYHLFRGGSGFNGLKLVGAKGIEIVHMNDYPATKPVNEQTDSDRVYPGDGAAPFEQIIHDLRMMGGVKVLSLELFNKTYWREDPVQVAKTGLQKMKSIVGHH